MTLAEFHDLVKKNDLPAVKQALDADNGLLTQKNSVGQSALLLSKYYGAKDVSQHLRELCGDELDIYEASAAGDLPAVQRALNLDSQRLESHSSDGWTPLHLAAFFGQTVIAEQLLDRGANVNARATNQMKNTPLHAAAAGGQTGLVELLLNHGADVNAKQHGGWTALHAACQAGRKEMALVLLAHAADTSTRADNNQLPLDLALLGGKSEIVELLENFDPPLSHPSN